MSAIKEAVEPKLSSDINVITAEINTYKRIAGEAIFEIGRRLKHVKENDLAHGDFGKWLESIGMTRDYAGRFIRIYDELGGSNYVTGRNIGFKSLYEIASLPESERAHPHTIPSTGEAKRPDEMTVRELREVKAALKQAEADRDKARQDYEVVRDTLESVRDVPPPEPHVEYVRNPDADERLRRYEERFGDIETYESEAFRIPNATDVSASIQAFGHEVRTLLKKYAYLTQYTRELSAIPVAVSEDYESTLEALSRFVMTLRDDADSAKHGVRIINAN